MKTTKFLIGTGSLALILTTVLFFTSCEKSDDSNSDQVSEEDIENVEDEIYADAVFEDIVNQSEMAEESELLKSTSCPEITRTQINDSTWQIVIDYGTTGCEQLVYNHWGQVVDTIVRKGKIVIERTGYYRLPGSVKTVTPEDYFVNDVQIEGVHKIENMGYTADSIMWFEVTLTGGKITTPDSIVITREMQHERYWIAGEETYPAVDDEYLIWGTVTGTTANGEEYTSTITDSLHISFACKFILSGTIEVVIGDHDPIIIDYGDDECDANATINRNGQSEEVYLRFRVRERSRRRVVARIENLQGIQNQNQLQNKNNIS